MIRTKLHLTLPILRIGLSRLFKLKSPYIENLFCQTLQIQILPSNCFDSLRHICHIHPCFSKSQRLCSSSHYNYTPQNSKIPILYVFCNSALFQKFYSSITIFFSSLKFLYVNHSSPPFVVSQINARDKNTSNYRTSCTKITICYMNMLKNKIHSDPYTLLNLTRTQRILILTPPLLNCLKLENAYLEKPNSNLY